jgi:hypothetical protein
MRSPIPRDPRQHPPVPKVFEELTFRLVVPGQSAVLSAKELFRILGERNDEYLPFDPVIAPVA